MLGRESTESQLYAEGDNSLWIERVLSFVHKAGPEQGLFLSLPDYRPDLAQFLAAKLGLHFVDFRATKMSELGWQAGKLTLGELSQNLSEQAALRGIMVLNVEALLATKTKAQRIDWYTAFVEAKFEHTALLVMTLFSEEIETEASRHLRLERSDIPEHGILKRMFELKEGGGARKEQAVLKM